MKSLTNKVLLLIAFIVGNKISEVQSQYNGPQYVFYKRQQPQTLSEDILRPKPSASEHIAQQQTNSNHLNDESSSNKIPFSIFEQLQNISVDEFLNNFVDKSQQQEADELSNDFFGIDVARRSSSIPKQAVCKPIDTVVELKPNNASSEFLYFPTCTTIRRCAGCCASSLFQCEPTETQMLNFEIFKNSAFINGRFSRMTKEIVTREQHDKCSCQCRIKSHHCNKYQQYDANNCVCNCINLDEKDKCDTNHLKIWMPENCTCACRQYEICTTGLHFDQNECKCTEVTTPLYPVTPNRNDRRQFILKPIFLNPDSKTNYDTTGSG